MQIIHQDNISAIFHDQIPTDRLNALNELLDSFKTTRNVQLDLSGISEYNSITKIVLNVFKKYGVFKNHELNYAHGFSNPNSVYYTSMGILNIPQIAIDEMELRGLKFIYIEI